MCTARPSELPLLTSSRLRFLLTRNDARFLSSSSLPERVPSPSLPSNFLRTRCEPAVRENFAGVSNFPSRFLFKSLPNRCLDSGDLSVRSTQPLEPSPCRSRTRATMNLVVGHGFANRGTLFVSGTNERYAFGSVRANDSWKTRITGNASFELTWTTSSNFCSVVGLRRRVETLRSIRVVIPATD